MIAKKTVIRIGALGALAMSLFAGLTPTASAACGSAPAGTWAQCQAPGVFTGFAMGSGKTLSAIAPGSTACKSGGSVFKVAAIAFPSQKVVTAIRSESATVTAQTTTPSTITSVICCADWTPC